MNKVIELSLIENKDKKKKVVNDVDNEIVLTNYKKKIMNDLDDVISLKFFKNKNPEDVKRNNLFIQIRNKFISFYNSYIELNTIFKEIKMGEDIVKSVLDDMLELVIFRAENIESIKNENVKEISLLKALDETKKETINIDRLNF
jgi:hypothetical protein